MAIPIASIQQQVANPFQMALQGFYQGQQAKQQEQDQSLRERQLALQESQVMASQQQAMAKQQRQQEIQQSLAAYYGNPDSSAQDAARLMTTYPELKDAMLEPYKNKTEEERSGLFKEMAEAYTMIDGGNLDMAKASIDRRIQAAENSNKPNDANLLRYAKEQMEANPETARKALLAQMYAVDPDRADKWIEGTRGPKDEATSKQKDYMFYRRDEEAAGRTPLSFNEWDKQSRAAGATKVTFNAGEEAPAIGTIPQGWQAIRDAETGEYTMKPVAGGPVAQELAQKEATKGMREAAAQRYGKIVLDDIDRSLKSIEKDPFWTTGFAGGQVLANLGGTAAKNLQQKLLTIKANIGFDRLQEMRQSSPTGGALGPVSDTENALLQATLGSVEQSQSADELKYNLKRLKDLYQDIVHGPGNRPFDKQSEQVPEGVDPADWEYMTPEEKALFAQ